MGRGALRGVVVGASTVRSSKSPAKPLGLALGGTAAGGEPEPDETGGPAGLKTPLAAAEAAAATGAAYSGGCASAFGGLAAVEGGLAGTGTPDDCHPALGVVGRTAAGAGAEAAAVEAGAGLLYTSDAADE